MDFTDSTFVHVDVDGKKVNRRLLKDGRKAGGKFLRCDKISHHWVISCQLYSVIYS